MATVQRFDKSDSTKRAFLEMLRKTANISKSAAACSVCRQTLYLWRDTYPEFAAEWDEVLEAAIDDLEEAARIRAVEGTEEYLTCGRGLVTDVDGKPLKKRVYSDTLLITLLRAHRPNKYRDRSSVEMNISTDLAERIESGRKRAIRENNGQNGTE